MRRVPGWLVILGVIAWFFGTLACAGGVFISARSFVISAGDAIPLPDLRLNNPAPTAVAIEPTPTPTIEHTVNITDDTNTSAPTDTAATDEPPTAPVIEPTAIQDDNALVRAALSRVGPRKVTVLLLGIDQRSAVESADNEFFRTDTMILLQIDPVRRSAAMLSIPRDLYVEIPGFRPARINTANYQGDASAYPGGGPALAMLTVKETLGIEIDHYVLVNFDVFTTVVDNVAPNGVEVCVQEPIYDPDYPDEGYGFIEVRFEPGCQRLDSTRLLQFARTRATNGADFDRARRQQQTITAIQREVVSTGGLVNLVGRAPTLWSELSGNLQTDLSFQEAVDLALITTTIDRESIQTGVIDNLYVTFDVDENGQQILIPVPSSIAVLVQDTFNNSGNLTIDDLRTRAADENAAVIILNNTQVQGLAGETQSWLSGRGVSATTGNVQTPNNSETIIRDYTGNPWTARYIAAVLGLPRERIRSGTDGATAADVAIVIGEDIRNYISGN